jgi:uncharacterized protein (TIGR02145 family)
MVNSCKKVEEEILLPGVQTLEIKILGADSASCTGMVSKNGNVDILMKGVVWNTDVDPTLEANSGYTSDSPGIGTFNGTLTHLTGNTKYYVRAYAKTNTKVIYGNTMEFTFLVAPSVVTTGATDVSCKLAILNGLVNPNFSTSIVSFQYGLTSDYKFKTSFTEYPLPVGYLFMVSFRINGLEPNTKYHYRILAENKIGSTSGIDSVFTTGDFITDIDGNRYTPLQIGNQTWLMEDLKVKHFNNGDEIANPVKMAGITTPAYWTYNDSFDDNDSYGYLYNFYTVSDSRNVCPVGWHVPSSPELTTMVKSLNNVYPGRVLRETGYFHWYNTDETITNATGFSALPGGFRNSNGFYKDRSKHGYWWTTTIVKDFNLTYGSQYGIVYTDQTIHTESVDMANGLSVRCIKDK